MSNEIEIELCVCGDEPYREDIFVGYKHRFYCETCDKSTRWF